MEPTNLNQQRRPESELNIRGLIASYLRYWYLFAIALVLAFFGAKYYNWYKNPVYAITAKLLVKDENATKNRLLQQLDSELPSKNIENEIEILRSHNLLAKALDELEFDVSYFLVGNVKVSEVYKDCPFKVIIDQLDYAAYYQSFMVHIVDSEYYQFTYESGDDTRLFEARFGEELDMGLGTISLIRRENFPSGELATSDYTKRNYKLSFNTIASNQNKYLSRLSVGLTRAQSTILQISVEDPVPQKGLDFVNTLVQVYLENDVNLKNKASAATAVFLDDQLNTITEDLDQIESNRENYKVSKGIIDLESESKMVLENIRDIDAQKAINDARFNMTQQLEKYISENSDLRDLAPAALDIDDPLLIKLINKLSELQGQRESIINESTPSAPQLIPLNAEIELTRASLLENTRNIKKSYQRKAAELESDIRKYKNRIELFPTTQRELLGIERRFRIQESLYIFLLEKRAELAISLAATESDTRIVDSARVLPGPISPVPQRAFSIALLLSFLIPVLLIIGIEKLNDRVKDIGIIRRITNIPILGIIRFNRHDSALVPIDQPRSSIAEEYRSIRTNLSFFGHGDKSTVIMVTSSIGTEGKTFTAMNMAAVMAASGAKVVLVGLDMRKPRIVDDFFLENSLGCSNYLSGNKLIGEVIQPSGKIDSLDILPSGPVPPNPSELIMSPAMTELIEELKLRYEKIIIDTPPIGLVSDGLILAKYADSTLFVVRDGVTKKAHLTQVNDLYEKDQLNHVGIVYNAVRRRNAAYGYNTGYGYGYGYVYGSEYGNYFEDDSEGLNLFKKWVKRFRKND